MQTVKIVYWQSGKFWIGHLQDYPDYQTQGKTLKELKENLRDLYRDITGGHIPGVRKVDDLVIS
jgi:hypothetical protein